MNEFVVTGYVGKDPEIKLTQNGVHCCSINLGVSGEGKTEGGEKKNTWLYLDAYNKTADTFCQYQKKGNFVICKGHIFVSTTKTQDGKTLSRTHLIADRIEFVNTHNDNSTAQNANRSQTAQNEATDDFGMSSLDISSDDLPF